MICYEHILYTLLRYRGALLPFYLFSEGDCFFLFPAFSHEMMERNVRTPARNTKREKSGETGKQSKINMTKLYNWINKDGYTNGSIYSLLNNKYMNHKTQGCQATPFNARKGLPTDILLGMVQPESPKNKLLWKWNSKC